MTNDTKFDSAFWIPDYIQNELESPDWESGGRVHNWKRYVDNDIQKMWKELSLREKLIIACFAEKLASQEEWD